MQSLNHILDDLSGKTVLMRVDFNVPLSDENGKITIDDTTRIEASLESIRVIQQAGAKLILCSHLGRPKSADDIQFSLKPVAEKLSTLLDSNIPLIPIETETKNFAEEMNNCDIILLENLRFNPGEKKNDPAFSVFLASLADIYVNDAFSMAHRAHASVVGVAEKLPSYSGFALEKELSALSQLTENPQRPFVVIIGGAKISDKVAAVKNLAKKADCILIGGGTANNFLKAEGIDIQSSYLEEKETVSGKKAQKINFVDMAEDLLEANENAKFMLDNTHQLPKIIMPIDVRASTDMDATNFKEFAVTDNSFETDHEYDEYLYLDIGSETIALFKQIISQAGTVFWNGPMGVFENTTFAEGTKTVATTIAESNAYSVIGGGDTVSAINAFNLENKFSHVSTAGGASLAFLGGETLPGLVALGYQTAEKTT